MAVRAIRGATQLEADEREHLLERTAELVRAVLEANDLGAEELISILFTVTPDLHSEFPAVAGRQIGLTDVPLMCMQEIDVPHALPRVVRMMVHAESPRSRDKIQHVYLHGAVALRPDLTGAQ
ncbi:chorismate mutase [Kribbella flavida DSM 17836]|uniref:chorismate mutase n=1 Tax=Kribbella flavida (strain DSM 17836 / JCM 10339 / NBRC 14399) TaxID=479435 RepID=D2Q4I1_KRIFD|nr:chorismate mutase [Kribbella flavida]ADB32295.1 chorismate mutase [Kribbella flavida DSM 17836]